MEQEKNDERLKFLSLEEASKESGYTAGYLKFLSQKGLLKARTQQGNWQTTREWLSELEENVSRSKTKYTVGRGKSFSSLSEEKNESKILEKKSEKKSENFRPNFLVTFGILAVVVVVAFLITSFAKYFIEKSNLASSSQKALEILNENEITNENVWLSEASKNGAGGQVLGEEIVFDVTNMASETYNLNQVMVGSNNVLLGKDNDTAMEIYDIKREVFVVAKEDAAPGAAEGGKGEVKIMVSWKTNKLAISDLFYSKNNGQEEKTLQENHYGFSHAVVLTGLEPQTSYVYNINCRDRWGNEKKSDNFGVFTPAEEVSVFDIISQAVGDIFGWAIKEN